jgi:hypothetical protein
MYPFVCLLALDVVLGGGPSIGAKFALQSLASSIEPVPTWWRGNHVDSALWVLRAIVTHSATFGVAVLVGLALIAIVALRTGRHSLAAAALIALLLAASVVVTFSSFPTNEFLALSYIDPMTWPVGMIVIVVAAWALVEVCLASIRQLAAHRRPRGERLTWGAPVAVRLVRLAAPILVLAVAGVTSQVVSATNAGRDTAEGWTVISKVRLVSAEIKHAVPRGRVEVIPTIGGLDSYALVCGVLWDLRSSGWQPTTTRFYATFIGPELAATPLLSTPRVTVGIRAGIASIGILRSTPTGRSGARALVRTGAKSMPGWTGRTGGFP